MARTIVDPPRAWLAVVAGALAGGVFMGLIGPFGSYDLAPERRVLYCVAIAVSGSAVLIPGMRLGLRLGETAGLPRWASALVSTLVLSLPIWLMFRAMAPWLWRALGEAPRSGSFWAGYMEVLIFLVPVGVTGSYLARRLRRHEPAPTVRIADAVEGGRLAASSAGPILALQAEDHYVRVHTETGSTLLLMRLGDAIAEVAGIDGSQVHRSWWVARAAVANAAVERRRTVLVLTSGVRVPVTREAAPRLRRAGWLARRG